MDPSYPRPSAEPARICERAQPRLPAAAARTERGRGLLGLARVDARRGRAGHRRGRPARLRRRLPRDAGRRLHGRRGVPLPRRRRGPRRRGGRRRGRDRDRPPPRGLRPRRDRAVPAGVGGRVPRPRSRSCARPACTSAWPRIRFVRARPTGSRRSAATPSATASSCTSTPTSSRSRSSSAARNTASAPSSCSPRRAASGRRTTIVHGTHATDAELDLLSDSGSRICACPTTEANLGDGFVPVERIRARGIGLCIGTDSNVRIDPFEELRELEGVARRMALRRMVVPPEELLAIGTLAGASALGLDAWDGIEIDTEHRSLAGVAPARGACGARLRVQRGRGRARLGIARPGR